MPTGLKITRNYYTVNNNTVTLEWDPPPGYGPETIVDNYTISLLSQPISHPNTNVILSSSWNVTLEYNVIYSINIIAVNCAGESSALILTGIEYGMLID